MTRIRRVLLLIESSRGYGRDCLRGVGAFLRTRESWRVLHVERSLSETFPKQLRRWRADGALTRMETTDMARVVASLQIPTVDLRGIHKLPNGALMDTDPEECGRLAVEHFLQRGYRHLGYCGYRGVAFSDDRCAAFCRHAAARGKEVHIDQMALAPSDMKDVVVRELRGELSEREVVTWLCRLPQPIGIFACNDVRGRQVLAACDEAGLAVPDQVAVLGVDNDVVVCDLSVPSLSSVEPDARRLGFEGAALLDRMMNGVAPPPQIVLVPPRGIQTRLSTDFIAVADPGTAAALRYIRSHACDGISVDRLARRLAISRTTLDRKFRQLLGRSPKMEIDRVRIERARQLLQATDYKLSAIASLVGFQTAAQFVTAFKRHTGITPGAYRSRETGW